MMSKAVISLCFVSLSAFADSPLPYKLMEKIFLSAFPPDAIEKLEILHVEPTERSKLAITYRVAIRDLRDPKHPARNKMQAIARFKKQRGHWDLEHVEDMEQTLEFLSER